MISALHIAPVSLSDLYFTGHDKLLAEMMLHSPQLSGGPGDITRVPVFRSPADASGFKYPSKAKTTKQLHPGVNFRIN
jgi:hypothetical protein